MGNTMSLLLEDLEESSNSFEQKNTVFLPEKLDFYPFTQLKMGISKEKKEYFK